MQKRQDEKLLDPEEVCKTWDCHEFIRHMKVLPPPRLIRLKTHDKCEKQIVVVLLLWRSSRILDPCKFKSPKEYTTKATKTEQSTPSTFITDDHEGAGIE